MAQRGVVGLCRSGAEFQIRPATTAAILILRAGPEDLVESAGEALVRAGPGVVPALVEMVRGADRLAMECAVRALGQMGPMAEPGVPEMLRQAILRKDPLFAAGVSNAVIDIRGTNVPPAGIERR